MTLGVSGANMLDDINNPIVAFFMQYAYEPMYVYAAITALMFASSFGLPFPEEVTLLSAGLLAHIGSNPELYPPPHPDAVGVDTVTVALVCFFSVLLSDVLVFSLGRQLGPHIRSTRWLQRIVKPEMWARIDAWTAKYGIWACGIFRFTPALRFPGHFTCGSLGIPYSTFLLVDGTAALVSVPTQVVAMAIYGKQVLTYLKDIKMVLASAFVIFVLIYFGKKWFKKKFAKLEAA